MEAGLAPYFFFVLTAMAFAFVAAIYQSYRLVGYGRRILWTFVLVGLILAVFHALADLRYVNPLWVPGAIVFCWIVLVPLSRFVGKHHRSE